VTPYLTQAHTSLAAIHNVSIGSSDFAQLTHVLKHTDHATRGMCTVCANKKQPLRKKFYISVIIAKFIRNLQILGVILGQRILATYAANFVTIFGLKITTI